MNYSEFILRIQALTRLMHQACQQKNYEDAYKFAHEIQAQAYQFKETLRQESIE
jgi:hypothetical protein